MPPSRKSAPVSGFRTLTRRGTTCGRPSVRSARSSWRSKASPIGISADGGVAPNNYPDGLSGYQVHGLKIESAGSGFIYTYVSVDDKDRNYPEKMNRFPLQDSELSSNNAVEQFPEWK